MAKTLLKIIGGGCVLLFLVTFSSQAGEYEHIAKAALFEKKGKFQAAIREYEKAINIAPHLVDVYGSIGYIYQYKLMKNRKAIEIYLKGLELDPNNYGLNLNIMYAYFDQGDLKNAIKHYEVLSKIRTDNDRYSFPRDTAQKLTKDMKKQDVVDFCKKYLAMNPTDIILREILVAVYKDREEYKNAEAELHDILKYGYETGSVYFDLGTCNYHFGHYQKSLEFFLKAKELGAYIPQSFFDKVHKKIKENE